MTVTERFLKLVSYPTTSDESSEACPSTPGQLTLAHEGSKQELKAVAVSCKDAQFNYREPLENYMGLAIGALSGDEKNSFGTSPFACNKVLNEIYPEEYENAKNLYVSSEYKIGDCDA